MFEDVDNKQAQPQATPAPTPEAKPEAPAPAQPAGKEEIHTMPMDYYMGDKTKQAVKGGAPATQSQAMKPMAPQATGGGGGNKKMILNIIIGVVLVLVVGVSSYLLYASYQKPKPEPSPVVVPVVDAVPVVVEEEVPVVEVEEEEAPPVEMEEEVLTFDPSLLNKVSLALLASKDTDKDGLTDLEEEIIGTNINLNDTDGDTYRDAEEIKNYYSPLKNGSTKLTEMNFIKEYENEIFGYKVLYPKAWLISPLDEDNPNDVMITSDGNEFVNILLNKKIANQTLEEWYLEKAPDVSATSLKKYKNHNDLAMIESPDAFTVYVSRGDEASYPSLFGMIVNSFEFTEKKGVEVEDKISFSSLIDLLALSSIDISEDEIEVSGSCETIECLSEKMQNCSEAKINIIFSESIAYEMVLIGEGEENCVYDSRFVKHSNLDFVNKKMTCEYSYGQSLDSVFLESVCEGPLFEMLSE